MRMYVLLAAAALCAASCFAIAPIIGTVDGGGAVPEGAQLETASVSRDVNLQNGVAVHFSPGSSGTVFSDHLVLDQGGLRVNHFQGYTVEAGQLQIQASDPASQAVVRMERQTVEVASLGGNVNVTDGGAMITRVTSGTRVSFRQSGNTTRSLPSDQHVMWWIIGASAAAALAIGITAWVQGKSPF